MIKRIIKETVNEYDSEGKLVKQTVTETTEDDDTVYFPTYNPYTPPITNPSWMSEPVCNCDASGVGQ